MEFDNFIKELIKQYPNDYDLGGKIRELNNQSKNIKTNNDGVQQEDTQEG
jgi:hypothetical protein